MKRVMSYLLLPALLLFFSACKNETKKTEDGQVLASSSTSGEANAAFNDGLNLLDQGDFQQAKAKFDQAISKDPKMVLAYLFRSNSAASAKEFADLLGKAKENLASANEWEKLYYDYNETFLRNDWNKRMEVAKKMTTTFPKSARAQVELGNVYSAGNQDAEARAAYQKAVDLDPKWVGGYGALVNSYVFAEPKDFKKAEENALKVVELAPNSSGAEIALGDTYRAQNDLAKARDAYAKAITLDPNGSGAYYKKGHANTFLGNYDEARQDYMNAAKHDDVKFGDVQNIANTYLYAGDRAMAMQYLMEQSKNMDATNDQTRIAKMNCITQCANIAMHTGDGAKLKELAAMFAPLSDQVGADIGTKEAMAVSKSDDMYWDALSDAVQGNFDAAKQKAESIKATLSSVTDPNKLNGYDFLLGYIDMKQKNYSSAISHFEKTQPANSMFNKFWLAMANEMAGNKDKAMSMYKEIVTYNFNDPGYALIRNEAKDKVK